MALNWEYDKDTECYVTGDSGTYWSIEPIDLSPHEKVFYLSIMREESDAIVDYQFPYRFETLRLAKSVAQLIEEG